MFILDKNCRKKEKRLTSSKTKNLNICHDMITNLQYVLDRIHGNATYSFQLSEKAFYHRSSHDI